MAETLPPTGPRAEAETAEAPRIRLLRRSVTALTVVLTLGTILVTGTLVWRLAGGGGSGGDRPAAAPVDGIAIPAGREVLALGGSRSEIMALTRDAGGAQRLMIFSRDTGALIGETEVRREP